MLALKAQHTFLGAVRGALRRTRHVGMTVDVCNQINKYAQDWEKVVQELRVEDPEHVERLLNWTGLGPQHYYDKYHITKIDGQHGKLTQQTDKQIRLVLSALTTSKRRYYRRKFVKLAADMEDERRAGKPGRVIKALLQRQRSVFDLNLLELPTGTL